MAQTRLIASAVWPEDASAVAAFMSGVFNSDGVQELQDTLKCSGALLVRGGGQRTQWPDGPLVGALTYTHLKGRVHINSLGVLASKRRNGVGSALMKEIIKRYGARATLTVAINTEWDGALRTFYANFGFVDTKEKNPHGSELWERKPPPLCCVM